jgi:hypothetical protein
MAYSDAHLSTAMSQIPQLLPAASGWNVHRQTIHEYRIYPHRFAEQASHRATETKFGDLKQGLDSYLPGIWVCNAIDLQTFPLNIETVIDPDVNLSQVNATSKPSGESFDDARAQNRLSAFDDNPDTDQGDQQKSRRKT